MDGAKLKVTGLVCLVAFALLALVVAHSRAPYGFEVPVLGGLGPPATAGFWNHVAESLGTPAVAAAVIASFVFGFLRRAVSRVALYGALALATFLINEHVAKPLVQRTLDGALTFPSGRVTAVSATALCAWLALSPLLGPRARRVLLVLGVAWVLLMSVAVVGAHWHTPLDDLGSILLSVGVVTTVAAVVEQVAKRKPSIGAAPARLAGSE